MSIYGIDYILEKENIRNMDQVINIAIGVISSGITSLLIYYFCLKKIPGQMVDELERGIEKDLDYIKEEKEHLTTVQYTLQREHDRLDKQIQPISSEFSSRYGILRKIDTLYTSNEKIEACREKSPDIALLMDSLQQLIHQNQSMAEENKKLSLRIQTLEQENRNLKKEQNRRSKERKSRTEEWER